MNTELKTIKVSDKGQITIPLHIQRMTGIKKGDNLVIYIKNKKILLQKIDRVLSQMDDDFKDIEASVEHSLGEFWKNEPDNVWEKYL